MADDSITDNVTNNVHAQSIDDALRLLQSTPSGLTRQEAARRLADVGPNVLQGTKPRSAGAILLDQMRSVVILLLLAAGIVTLIMGDVLDTIAIGAVILINTLLGFITEFRARRAMEALLQFDVPHAMVIRDSMTFDIEARDLVPGDIIQLDAGAAVPADVRLIRARDVRTNEALLTGESVPVEKQLDPLPTETMVPDRSNMLYKGTVVVAGTGRAVVSATGMRTEIGRINAMVGAIPDEETPLEHRLDTLGRRLVWVALGVGAVVAALGALQHMPLGRMIETGIALAIAAVPEGLPAVATIALAVGVRRMAKRHALVRRLPSVETLGSVTVVCTDKTGTLTAGEMTMTTLAFADHEVSVTGVGYAPEGAFTHGDRAITPNDDAVLREALRIGMMANRAGIEHIDDRWRASGDPTEAALLVAGMKGGLTRATLIAESPEVDEVPFSSERMLMATFHRSATDGDVIVAYVKGAPGRLLERCTRMLTATGESPLTDSERDRLLECNDALAERGLRVLALARGTATDTQESALRELTFVAFAGLMDPIASDVPETITRLHNAGIRTVMLTGDQQQTARAIARTLGIITDTTDNDDHIIDGRTLRRRSPEDADDRVMVDRIAKARVVSRVSPEDKLRIISAYQTHGDIVAMLGDGVNDAAALKKANVGVAMGQRGTDVAKEAAAIVLQDDRFRTIAAAVEEGRVIFDNIRKFVFYLFSCNLAEILVLLVAGVAQLPAPLLPLQILWLNLITDTFPALALAVEPAESDIMRHPPRDPQQAIISGPFLRLICGYAFLITVVTLAALLIGLAEDPSNHRQAITMSFTTLAIAQALHLGNARNHTSILSLRRLLSNPYAIAAAVLVIALQIAAVHFEPLATILRTVPLRPVDWVIVLGLSAVPVVVGQGIMLVRTSRRSGRGVPHSQGAKPERAI